MPRWALSSAIAVTALFGPAVGRAQTPEAPSLRAPVPSSDAAARPAGVPEQALDHYARGRALYLEGRYGEALAELSAALGYDPRSPELHYNVARLHELLGHIDPAIAAYEAYRALIVARDPDEAARIDITLKRLRGARNELKPEPAPPPRIVTVVRAAPRRGLADAWFWSVGGLGVGSLLGAGASGAAALWLDDRHGRFVLGRDGGTSAYDREGTRLHRVALASDALTIAGSALTLSAILLYALRTKPVQPVIQVSQHGGELWLGLRGCL